MPVCRHRPFAMRSGLALHITLFVPVWLPRPWPLDTINVAYMTWSDLAMDHHSVLISQIQTLGLSLSNTRSALWNYGGYPDTLRGYSTIPLHWHCLNGTCSPGHALHPLLTFLTFSAWNG
jgi:hypothetical protein